MRETGEEGKLSEESFSSLPRTPSILSKTFIEQA